VDLPKSQESLDQLVRVTQDVWGEFEDKVFENLVKSMPKRMKAVIDNKSWYNKYLYISLKSARLKGDFHIYNIIIDNYLHAQ
jgi:hypothetical protein